MMLQLAYKCTDTSDSSIVKHQNWFKIYLESFTDNNVIGCSLENVNSYYHHETALKSHILANTVPQIPSFLYQVFDKLLE